MRDLFNGSALYIYSRGHISRLGKLKSTNGKRYIKFSIAHNFKVNGHVEYVNLIAYDKQADQIEEYATLGTWIEAYATPYTSRYEDKKTKKLKAVTDNRVSQIAFLGNTKLFNSYKYQDLNKHELAEMQESVKDINHIEIAKKLLAEEGYQIIQKQSSTDILE